MKQVILKTFGGLTIQYYIRQFIFGLIFSAFFYFSSIREGAQPIPLAIMLGLFVVNSFLYPYSRFVYENVMNFIIGGNVFWVNAIVMLFVKFITMAICWSFAIFIAPIGLAYLYFYHSKNEQKTSV